LELEHISRRIPHKSNRAHGDEGVQEFQVVLRENQWRRMMTNLIKIAKKPRDQMVVKTAGFGGLGTINKSKNNRELARYVDLNCEFH
jgi:hypothetical protein